MERNHAVEQPFAEPEQRKSFDILAGVRLLRYDFAEFGAPMPETRRRILDEDLSFMAEAADAPSRTNFTLQRGPDGELLYFEKNRLVDYGGMLQTGREVAKAEAIVDLRRQFLVDWASNDLMQGYGMRQLQPGQRLSWTNGFPHEIAARYGTDFVRSLGLRPDRQMGFLYQAVCHEDGSVELWSQTVDRSDPEALAAVEQATELDSELDIEGMLRVYDGTLRKRHGGTFYAGSTAYEKHQNVWRQILAQKDLIQYYLDGLETLARSQPASREQLEQQTKQHIIGSWLLFKDRFAGRLPGGDHWPGASMSFDYLQQTATHRLRNFAEQGQFMEGCGTAMSLLAIGGLNGDPMNMAMEDARDAVFGKSSETKYSFDQHMYCVVCQAPPPTKTAPKKMCGPCGICRGCDTQIKSKKAGQKAFALAA